MIINKFSEIFKKNILIMVVLMTACLAIAGLRIWYYIKSPNVLLLINRAGAQWIKYDSEFELETKAVTRTKCEFKFVFNTDHDIDNAGITFQALKSAQVLFDGINVFDSDYKSAEWKKVRDIKLPFKVESGPHEISIIVTSENSPPALIAYSESLPVNTGKGWLASLNNSEWLAAVPVSPVKQPAISNKYPSSMKALLTILPYISVLFVITFLIFQFSDWEKNYNRKFINWLFQPSNVRWIMLLSWAMLAINNMFKLDFQVGSDILAHVEYIDYIVTKGSLPKFYEGWQTHQGPLNYILSAPLYALLIKWFDLPSVIKMMTIIPVVCGLIQIEIVYRAARLVFAERKDLQIIAVITGTLLPIHTYECQYMSNEPLAACFTSLVILLCLPLIMPGQKERQNGYFILIGFIWGLALLSKMTAAPLAPVLFVVLIFYTVSTGQSRKQILKPIMIVFGISTLVASWYLFQIYMQAGNIFVENKISRSLQWWQDPGYRTLSQIFSFGQSLIYPVYSGVVSFGDTLYSTLWLDGFNSGLMDFIPWNYNFMIAGALLALLPSMFILTGLIYACLNKNVIYKKSVFFSAGAIAVFFIALLDFYILNPIYSGTKAHYTLGLLSCYAILVAAGAEPFLQNRIVRSFVMALFACWAFAAYTAYFVV